MLEILYWLKNNKFKFYLINWFDKVELHIKFTFYNKYYKFKIIILYIISFIKKNIRNIIKGDIGIVNYF